MISVDSVGGIGYVTLQHVSGRGFTPEELVDGVVDKIVFVGDKSHPAVQAQARAFRDQVRTLVLAYGEQCVASYQTTLTTQLNNAGHGDLTSLLET